MPKTKKFLKLLKATKEHYIGKEVPKKYQKRYGKRYSKEEAESIAFAIAKAKGWRI
jgi:HEPN domain-containing protein